VASAGTAPFGPRATSPSKIWAATSGFASAICGSSDPIGPDSATRSVPPRGVFGVGDGVAGGALDGRTTADGVGVDAGDVA